MVVVKKNTTLLPPDTPEPLDNPKAFDKYQPKQPTSLYHYLPGRNITDDARIRILAQNTGHVSSYFYQLAKTWDQGNRRTREKILVDFVRHNQHKTGPQLEVELGNGASLFLTRISAYLRLTYLVGYRIQLQLQAISIFISASGGHRFLAEFLEVGGVLTVLELLGLPQVKDPDRAEALRLLIHIATAGRSYREFICESYGIRAVADCLARTRSDIVADYCRNLLYQLGTASQMSPLSQQMGGQTIRLLLPNLPSLHRNVVEGALYLLKSPNIHIQYEGFELLKDLIKRPNLQDHVLLNLIAILKLVTADIDAMSDFDLHKKEKNEWGANLRKKKEDRMDEFDSLHATYVQQAYAAKLLGMFAATSSALARRMIQFKVVPGLLNTIANVGHPESQKYAANALLFLCEEHKVQLADYMGVPFEFMFMERPDTFYRELTRDQIRALRHNNVNSTIQAAESTHSLEEDQEQHLDEGQEEPDHDEKGDMDSKSMEKAKKALSLMQETLLEPKKETEFVKTMFIPYTLATGKGTLAGNSMHPDDTMDFNDKFNTELEKSKKKKLIKDLAAKPETHLVLEDSLNEHMQTLVKDKDLFKKTLKKNLNEDKAAELDVDEAALNAKREVKEIKIRMAAVESYDQDASTLPDTMLSTLSAAPSDASLPSMAAAASMADTSTLPAVTEQPEKPTSSNSRPTTSQAPSKPSSPRRQGSASKSVNFAE